MGESEGTISEAELWSKVIVGLEDFWQELAGFHLPRVRLNRDSTLFIFVSISLFCDFAWELFVKMKKN